MSAADIEARYAEHRPPEPVEDFGPNGKFVTWHCYVCGEYTLPSRGSCRDCGATWCPSVTDEPCPTCLGKRVVAHGRLVWSDLPCPDCAPSVTDET